MEKAIFISNISGLQYLQDKYTRLYFGNEFCERLMPSADELREVLRYVQRRSIGFTFVTPYVTNNGMDRIGQLLEFLNWAGPMVEIVINDWGLHRFISHRFRKGNFLLGRLLTKQKRGPRILNLIGKVPRTMLEHFRCAASDTSVTKEFLTGSGFSRIELDNLLQGVVRGTSLKASLYIPFGYITTTRFCLFASWKNSARQLKAIRPCSKECRDFEAFQLAHRNMPVEIFLKGNSQFFENNSVPHNLEDLNIDRIVYEPEIPM